MTDDLIKGIKGRLEAQRLQKSALDAPTAHVVVSDDKGDVHVLTKKDAAPIDAMEARVAGKALEVKEGDEVDLKDLGVWRDFVVSGFDAIKAPAPDARPLTIEFIAKTSAVPSGSAFFASLDLGFAMAEVLDRGELLVRPIPAGERDGEKFAAVSNEMRALIGKLLGIHVDDTVPADVVQRAVVEYRRMQEAASGLLSAAITLGVPALATPLPNVSAPKKAAPEQDDGDGGVTRFSGATRAVLDDLGVTLSAPPTAEEIEEALDRLPDDVADKVAIELRAAYTAALDRVATADNAADDFLFGGDEPAQADAAPKQQVVQAGASRLAQARGYRQAQLEEGLKDLGVPQATTQKLADLLAVALQPGPKPSIILVAGAQHTPADRVMELATRIVGDSPLVIARTDLATRGFAPVFGHNNGVSTMRDAILSTGEMNKHRPTAARHVPVVVEDLSVVGSTQPDSQKATLKDWLERVVEMSNTGKVESWENEERRTTSLANSVFLMRWPGDPAELRAALSSEPQLKHLVNNLIEVAEDASTGVAFLAGDMASRLVATGAPQGTRVEIAADLRASLEKAYEKLGSTEAYERIAARMAAELKVASDALPAASYTVSFNRGLTARERERALQGTAIAGATHVFDVAAGAPGEELTLEFNSRWEDVLTQAKRAGTLEQEVVRLRGELAKAGAKSDPPRATQ